MKYRPLTLERLLIVTNLSYFPYVDRQIARGSSCRQGTDARLRCLAAQAAASAMSKANEAINPIGIPEVIFLAVWSRMRYLFSLAFRQCTAVHTYHICH